MDIVVSRWLTAAFCFGLACAVSLGVSSAATALPRNPAEMGVRFSAASPLAARDRGALIATWRRSRSRTQYRFGEHVVAQISPTILRRADVELGESSHPSCAMKAHRRSACRTSPIRPKGLPDALLESPTLATERSLKELGIPAIKDVPPIVILRAGTPVVDEIPSPNCVDAAGRARQRV